jgi:hypothetical protein
MKGILLAAFVALLASPALAQADPCEPEDNLFAPPPGSNSMIDMQRKIRERNCWEQRKREKADMQRQLDQLRLAPLAINPSGGPTSPKKGGLGAHTQLSAGAQCTASIPRLGKPSDQPMPVSTAPTKAMAAAECGPDHARAYEQSGDRLAQAAEVRLGFGHDNHAVGA